MIHLKSRYKKKNIVIEIRNKKNELHILLK